MLMGMVTPKEDDSTRDLVTGGVQSQVGPVIAEKVLRMILLASLIRAGSSQPDQGEEDRQRRRSESDYIDDGFLTVMVLLYTAVIILGTLVFERFWRQWSSWIQSQPTCPLDDAEAARRERSRAYAEVRSQIRQADRARRAAADRLLELQMRDEEQREWEVSRRRSVMRTQRFDAFTRADRSRTPTRCSPVQDLETLREEENQHAEDYASPSESDEIQILSEGRGEEGEEETPDLFAEDMSVEERPRGTSEGRSRATSEVPGRPGDGQDLRRHLELRELEQYHRSIHEGNYEELRRQHQVGGQALLSGGAGDSSGTRETSSITPTEEEERLSEEGGQVQHGQPGAVEDPVLGDQMLQEEAEEENLGDQMLQEEAEEENPGENLQEERMVSEEGEEETPEFDPPPPEGEEETPEPFEEARPDPRPSSGSPGEPEPEDEDQSYLPEYGAFVTGGGNCYHTNMMCCTLANTRTLRRSSWCPVCARITDSERYRTAYIQRQGADAHLDQGCRALQGQFALPYRHCQRCGTFPRRRTQEG